MSFSGVGTGGENNASFDRIVGHLLIWLQDMGRNGVPVFVFATASHLERVPAELMRLGRFDEKFFFLPTPDECRAIATLHLAKHACMLADVDGRALADGDALAGALEGDAYRARIERAGGGRPVACRRRPVGRRRAWLPRGLRGHARQGDLRRRRCGQRALDVRHSAGVIGAKQVN